MSIKNTVLLLLSTFVIFPSTLHAQGGMLASPVETQFSDGSLTVMLHAFFVFGIGPTCPEMTWDATIEQDTVHLRAFYDASGPWPQAGCDKYDTVIIFPVDESLCILSVNYFLTYSGNGGSDTVAVDATEIVSFCALGVPEHAAGRWTIYPTAFTDHIQLARIGGGRSAAQIQLLNAQGRVVLQFQRPVEVGERLQLPQNLPNGPYWLVIEDKGRRSTFPLQRVPQE